MVYPLVRKKEKHKRTTKKKKKNYSICTSLVATNAREDAQKIYFRPQAGHLSRRSISLDCCFVMSLEFVASAEVDMRMRISIPHEPAAGNNSCLCSCAFLGWFFFSHCSPSGVYGYRIFHSTSARGPASTCTHFAAHTHTHTPHTHSPSLLPQELGHLLGTFSKASCML